MANNKVNIVKGILARRNDAAIMRERQQELTAMVEANGADIVALATGLKESTIGQYVRDRNARISLTAIDQARYVFNHPQYVAAQQK